MRGKATLNSDLIHEQLLKTIAEHFLADPEQFELDFTRPPEIPDWPLPAGSAPRVVFYLPERLSLGNLNTTAVIYDGKNLLGKIDVHARLSRYQNVIRTTGTINHNQPFSPQNIRTERRLLTTGTGDEFATVVIGRVARRTLPAHSLIRTRDLMEAKTQAITVRSQSPVQLVARVGGVTVTMNNAIALQSGSVGDMIQVRNLQSRTTHVGKITSSSQVEVISR